MKNAILFLGAAYIFSSCAHKTYDALEWQDKKVNADGKISEWSNPLRFYDDKTKLNYTIANDRKNLYLCIKVSDETTQIKILRAGMEFKIDTIGKKSFPTSFVFPMTNLQTHENHKSNSQNESESEKNDANGNHSAKSYSHSKPEMKIKLLGQVKDMQLFGFKPPLGGIVPLLNNTTGISAAINIDSTDVMYYEAIIPFSTFYKNELVAADTNTVFNYRIEINALPAPASHEGGGGGGMHGGGGGGMAGGMAGGGMRGGGMGGGGGMHGGGSSSGNSEMYVSNRVTIKMKLSYK